MDEKVKTKSIDTVSDEEIYNKIVNEVPLHDENADYEFGNIPEEFIQPFPTNTLNLPDSPETEIGQTLRKMELTFEKMSNQLTSLLEDGIYDHLYIKSYRRGQVTVLCDIVNQTLCKNLNKISSEWSVEKYNRNTEYSLIITINITEK